MNLRTVLPPVIVAVLGLGALSGIQDTGFRAGIESDLTERAQGALSAAGLDGVEVEITGRDADVTAPTVLAALAAADVVSGVDGIRVAAAYGPNGPASADAGAPEGAVAQSASRRPRSTPPTSGPARRRRRPSRPRRRRTARAGRTRRPRGTSRSVLRRARSGSRPRRTWSRSRTSRSSRTARG